MSLQNMLIFYWNMLNFFKSEPKYAYKRYAYKKKHVYGFVGLLNEYVTLND